MDNQLNNSKIILMTFLGKAGKNPGAINQGKEFLALPTVSENGNSEVW